MTKNKIRDLIKLSIKKAQSNKNLPEFDIPKINLEHPENSQFGDYSSNIAMQIVKMARKNPLEIAKIIKDNIKEDKDIAKVEVVKPGFINFYLSNEYFQDQIKEIVKQKDGFGNSNIGKGKKVHLDFVSANPTGPVHLGNGRGGPYGDVLANVLERAGYKPWREYYINDYGNQIVALGHSILKDDKAVYKGDYIDDLNKRISGKDPDEVGFKGTKEIVENIIKPSMEKLGIKFDNYFSERSLHDDGKIEKRFEELKKKDLIYEKDGALWFRATKFGDEKDRVVKKSTGEITYFGGDIAYHEDKFERGNDLAIDVWGADHHGDVIRVMGAVEALGYGGKLKIILTQFIRVLKDGKEFKMSKRAGTYVTIDDLLDKVGKDAVRFFFLMHSHNTHMDFDLDLAREKSNKNPVYYVQYAYARISSIFRKAGISENDLMKYKADLSLLKEEAEINLMRELNILPEIMVDIVKSYEVHKLTFYAISLADKFHNFYEKCRVLDENKELRKARLTLLMAAKIVLKNTLDILGVGAPERM